jgi:hypothetical protein
MQTNHSEWHVILSVRRGDKDLLFFAPRYRLIDGSFNSFSQSLIQCGARHKSQER